ncbi:F-box only protein 22-like [Ptychodera flava]|uniref:F-box only protein 22-like n=1 Tax=Ptychodera flava TaxID=63121 RepID=UPI00396A77EB
MDASATCEVTSDRASWILTHMHEVVENFMSFLPAKMLNTCARVCKCWNTVATKVLRHRQSISWAVYQPAVLSPDEDDSEEDSSGSCDDNDDNDDRDECDELRSSFTTELEKCLQNCCSIPRLALLFMEPDSDSLFPENGASAGNSIESYLHQCLPPNCQLVGFNTPGVISTSQDMMHISESESQKESCACILVPKMNGVNIHILKISKKEFLKGCHRENILSTMGAPDDVDLKCIILIGFNRFAFQAMGQVVNYLHDAFRKRNRAVVIVGAYANDIVTPRTLEEEERKTGILGIGFSGPNVQAASVILDSKVSKLDHAITEIQKLKQAGLDEKKSIAFMFACIGRGHYYYNEYNVESTAFKSVFPTTPLFGFFGNGEIGCEQLRCGPIEETAKSRPELVHAYTSVFCMLSFK